MINKQKITKRFTMEQDYDYRGDSLLLYVDEEYTHKKSIRLTPDVILDFDDNDVPVALELLNASKILGVKKSALTRPIGLNMHICVGEEVIKLEAEIFVSIHEKQIQLPLVEEIANNANLIANETYFARATA